MAFRKFGTPEHIEPVSDERQENGDPQGINVTAAREDEPRQYTIDEIENEEPQ